MKKQICHQYEIMIIDYIDGYLEKGKRGLVDNHLKSCKYCQQEFEDTRILLREMDAVEDDRPDPDLKEEFQRMLNQEIEKNILKSNGKEIRYQFYRSVTRKWWFRAAAGIALFIAGAVSGQLFQSNVLPGNETALNLLRNDEIRDMEQLMTSNSAQYESPSARIRFIDSLDLSGNPDPAITDLMLETLNRDKNINVRFKAAQSLAHYTGNEKVRQGLVESLIYQQDPLIQITLIRILVQSEETNAVQIMKYIMYHPDNHELVREEAEKAIEILS